MTRPRSLADELAELVNPAPQAELDPEAAGIGEGDALGGSDDELAGLVGAAARGRRAIPADIALEGGQYQGRRSSRAALFGGDEQQQVSSSEEGDDAGSDSDDAQQQLGGVRLSRAVQGALPPGRRDLSTIPTMFANGHAHHGPGLDDPTSSSSLFSDEGEEEGEEAQQQQQQQQAQGAVSPVQQQEAAATAARVQQQQQQGEGEKSGSSEDDEGGSGQEDQAQQQQQQQRLDQEAAEGSSSEEGGSEEGSEEEHDEMDAAAAGSDEDDSEDEDEDEDEAGHEGAGGDGDGQMLGANGLDVDAAAAGVAAMLGDDEEMQQLEREAAAAQAEAAQQLVAAGARSGRDAEKAAGVREQQRLWGAALELRIRLQRALAGGNSLPRPAARAALAGHSPQVARGYSELLGSCQATLQDMLTLHHSLAQQHPAAAAALAAAEATQQQQQQLGSKSKRSRSAAGLDDDSEQQQQPAAVKYAGSCRTADEAWSAVDAAISNLAGFRDASLDKWHRRTVLSSGTAALRGSSGLRALQQSVSSQVAALMADSAKLVARSQLPLELAPRPLGTPARAQPQPGGSDDEGDADDGRRQPGGGGRRERARDAETYDEGDFYQQLLKELLEAAPPGSLPQQLAGARPPKRRKLVDRRASKGRKLRYHVMEKLVGFMAPAELVPPPFAEQLFGNLFSHQG